MRDYDLKKLIKQEIENCLNEFVKKHGLMQQYSKRLYGLPPTPINVEKKFDQIDDDISKIHEFLGVEQTIIPSVPAQTKLRKKPIIKWF